MINKPALTSRERFDAAGPGLPRWIGARSMDLGSGTVRSATSATKPNNRRPLAQSLVKTPTTRPVRRSSATGISRRW
jgi:hypothetical protein